MLRSDSVGASIGEGVTRRALEAVGLAALAVVIYITFAFRGIPHAFRYGICAIIAMVHDVLIVLALTGYGAKFFGWQVDSLYLTALLTVIGFSVQDKIVVFDRIRENSRYLPQTGLRKTCQPFDRANSAAFDQHPVDDSGILPAVPRSFRRRYFARIRSDPAGRTAQRYIFFNFHRSSAAGGLGKERMENLVPQKPGSHCLKKS